MRISLYGRGNLEKLISTCSMDLISIVIPVYNQKESLKQALDSIYCQTYKNKEIIIVDDGSDELVSQANLNIKKKESIKIIRQKNKGAPAARNRGLQEVRGNFVIFWDADVVAIPEMLEKMHDKLFECQEASFVYCNMKYGKKKMSAQEFDKANLKENNYIHSTSLIRAQDVISWDESLDRFQDWDLWLSMVEQNKTGVWIDEYLFTVIPNEGGISDWLPRFAYKPPFKWIPGIKSRVESYEKAKAKVQEKHDII